MRTRGENNGENRSDNGVGGGYGSGDEDEGGSESKMRERENAQTKFCIGQRRNNGPDVMSGEDQSY